MTGILSNKLRSILTMLGVIIGVGAVIAMVSLGEGANQQVTSRIASLGSDLLLIQPGRGGSGGARGSAQLLTIEHAEAITQKTSAIEAVAPQVSRNASVRYEGVGLEFSVVGTTSSYLVVRNLDLLWGRFFSPEDSSGLRRVAVLGMEAAREIFSGAYPIGQSIRINDRTFEVIGVLEEKGEGAMMSPDSSIFVPITTAQKRLFGTDFLSLISVKGLSGDLISQAEEEIRFILTDMLGSSDAFIIQNMQEMLAAIEDTTRTFTMLLAGIASISLLVGGIGIMNIMLVSVTERTREIGIRKAIGATRRDILMQFIIEAMVLSGLGGILGISAGIGGAWLFSALMNWVTFISPLSIIIGFGFSVAVGLFFGIWPASSAASLDPITALRYE